MPHNPAKTLKDQIWGQDWIQAIPLKFRSALKYLNFKTPGVDNSVEPDAIGVGGVINSQVVTNRTNEREKTTSQLDGSVVQHTYHDQEYDEQFDVVFPVDKYLTEEGAELGEPRRKIEGLTPGIDSVETISPNTTVLDNYLIYFPGTTNVDLPDVLESVKAILETSVGDGDYHETGSAAWAGQGSASLSLQATSQASAAIMPDVDVRITSPWTRYAQSIHYLFFLPLPVTPTAVVDKLVALLGRPVQAWPVFKPRTETVYCIGQRKSLQVRATAHWQDGGSDSGSEHAEGSGTGFSTDVALTIKVVRIPPTIHNDVVLSGELSGSAGLLATATEIISSGSFANISKSDTVFGRVSALIKKTVGDFELPATGLRILQTDVQPYKWGYAMVRATVIDFASLNYGASLFGSGEGTVPTVFYEGVTNLSNTSATVNGSVATGGLATTYHLEYGATTSYGTNTAPVVMAASTIPQPVAFNLTGLPTSTLRHYRIVATNSLGTATGADRTFTTHTYPTFARYIYTVLRITGDEVDNGGNSFDFFQIKDSVTGYSIGLFCDYDAQLWKLYQSSGGATSDVTRAATGTSFRDVWHIVEVFLVSDGETLTTTFTVDGALGSPSLTHVAGQSFNTLYVGAKNVRTSTQAKRSFSQVRVGTSRTNDNLFNGQIDASIVPPYDSVVGTGMSITGSNNDRLHAEETTAETYAVTNV